MTDTLLHPPVVQRPEPRLTKHGNHWDATGFVTRDGGWTWRATTAVNMPTEEHAQKWLDDLASGLPCPIHGDECEAWK